VCEPFLNIDITSENLMLKFIFLSSLVVKKIITAISALEKSNVFK